MKNAPPSAGEVRAVAHQLMTWAEGLAVSHAYDVAESDEAAGDILIELAKAVREIRHMRVRIFPGVSLGEPAWDVLLDLFIKEAEGFRVSLDHLSFEGDIPAHTVYRAVDLLTDLGLVARAADRFDDRVVWLTLSDKGRDGMIGLLQQSAGLVRPLRDGGPVLVQASA